VQHHLQLSVLQAGSALRPISGQPQTQAAIRYGSSCSERVVVASHGFGDVEWPRRAAVELPSQHLPAVRICKEQTTCHGSRSSRSSSRA
jgi:hypothetical protein